MDIYDILTKIVNNRVEDVKSMGYMKPGHNGPYYDEETPVRNTAHFITTLHYLYQESKDDLYLDAINKCGRYLLSKDARPYGKGFICRINKDKNLSNGIIGPAWAIEGLVSAYKATSEKEYIELAKEVFLLNNFDEDYKMWKIIEPDGTDMGFDTTFNHQLWFSAAGTQILSVEEDIEIRSRCNQFLQNVDNHIGAYNNGLIKHPVNNYKRFHNELMNRTYLFINGIRNKKRLYYKENGYHLFNVYAFALIKNNGFNLNYFDSKEFKKHLEYCFSSELYNWLLHKSIDFDGNYMPKVKNNDFNIYGFSYNAPGFELPYIYLTFRNLIGNKDEFVNSIVSKQIDLTYSESELAFKRNNEDPITLESRIYEYVRSLMI